MNSSARCLLLFLASLVSVALCAPARADSSKFRYEAIARAPVGAWAEYRVAFKGRAETGTQRYALVERTRRRLVLEIELLMAMGPSTIHLEYAFEPPFAWRLTSGKIRMANGRSIPLPASGQDDYALIKKGLGLGERLGEEVLETSRGALRCEHWQRSLPQGSASLVTDFWTNDTVFPVGLVRSLVESKGMEVTLLSVGKGARAKVQSDPPPRVGAPPSR